MLPSGAQSTLWTVEWEAGEAELVRDCFLEEVTS